MENKLHSIEISRSLWRLLVWSLISAGAILMVTFYTILNNLFVGQDPFKQGISFMLLILGCIVLGFGFGLAYSRTFKIRGIDNEPSN